MELDWKTIKSAEIHRNPWYRLMQDDVVMPSGQQGKYTYIDRLPAVVIAAMTPEDEVYLVGQFRYPIKKFSWELPKGAIEKADLDLLSAAKTELLEEVGLEAEDWQSLGSYYLDVALTNQAAHLFLARKLSQKKSSPDFTEFLTSKKIKLDDLEKMIAENQIYDSSTISAYFKLKTFLQANDK
jgi:8-oxo-dGDP phosphatase